MSGWLLFCPARVITFDFDCTKPVRNTNLCGQTGKTDSQVEANKRQFSYRPFIMQPRRQTTLRKEYQEEFALTCVLSPNGENLNDF